MGNENITNNVKKLTRVFGGTTLAVEERKADFDENGNLKGMLNEIREMYRNQKKQPASQNKNGIPRKHRQTMINYTFMIF